jgi:hypothetical protein
VPIPLYRYDGALIDFISPKCAEKLFDAGRAKLARHKKGAINRVILHRMPGEPAPMRVADYLGKRYSYQQHLDGGHRCWTLKSFSGDRSESDLAPDELRPLFLNVQRGCMEAA